MNLFATTAAVPGAVPGAATLPGWDVSGLVAQIEAGTPDDPGLGGWSGGFANQAHWDPDRSREWRCWAQTGPTWSAHCGAEVPANDTLGLCRRHRHALVEGDAGDLEGLGGERGNGSGRRGDLALAGA